MKVASIETVINAPFPTKACGHIEQDFLIDTYKDDLYLRIFGLEEDDKLFLHLSFDLLGLKENICNKITESAQSIFKNKRVHCVVSCTHTHYGNDINNSEYILFLLKKVREAFQNMEFKEYGQLYYSIYIERYNKIGKSRISDYETNNEYLLFFN